jgi:formylmethanofuran dehydrogenase subunit C
VSIDDGINVAGGNDGSSVQGRPGRNNFSESGDNKLDISGGYVSVNALGDGLDANGSMYMSGGTVVVSGPTNNWNGALDYDGVFEMSGGFLAAAGSSGMAQALPNNQSIFRNYELLNVQQAGTLVHLEDSEGRLY